MSIDFYQSNPKKLRSPLLDSISKNKIVKESKEKGKKIYFNLKEETATKDYPEETLNKPLFNDSGNNFQLNYTREVNQKTIKCLETIIKIVLIFIVASGGIFTLLELVNIIRQIYTGSYYFGNSLIVFTFGFISTSLASIICLGFLHLIRTTRYIYGDLENQNQKINKLLSLYNLK